MSVLPPILDVFVVWHPDEFGGAAVLDGLQEHFHGPAFAGLAGGAVEVYGRSAPWGSTEVPRPLGLASGLAPGVVSAQINVVVVVAGAALAAATANGGPWWDYVNDLLEARAGGGEVFAVPKPGFTLSGTILEDLFAERQALAPEGFDDHRLLARDLCQAVTQHLSDGERIRVFVSHTKATSLLDPAEPGGIRLFEEVRASIARTRLSTFFDAQDIQTGEVWEKVLDSAAASSALLMVRTDRYAGRAWTQREVLEAKQNDMPIVCMYALGEGEDRGSFLMDHVPSVSCDPEAPDSGIRRALERLVDEALKRALWLAQQVYLRNDGFDWTPVHAPEPATLGRWLRTHPATPDDDSHLWVMHPDPPLGPQERVVIDDVCALAGYVDNVIIVTPRTFAARGGQLS